MTQTIPSFMLKAAEEYIAFDKSDPFTRMRVYSHIRNGIATSMRATPARENKWNFTIDKSGLQRKPLTPENAGERATYDAVRSQEHRSYENNGERIEYTVPAFKNVVRP